RVAGEAALLWERIYPRKSLKTEDISRLKPLPRDGGLHQQLTGTEPKNSRELFLTSLAMARRGGRQGWQAIKK
ncbi:hypothetical protein, partial [Pseudomonas sp. UBA2684]|uniref:hypothetical protein n=1 Tax=Pseudomonas sp. UBA2684 TaxID=1947311 RepID=UPI0025CBE0DF